MGRGGEGGNEASNVEVLLFKVEVALSKVHGHDLSIFIRWTSWQFGWTSLPESRSDDQTTLPPHGDHSTTGASKTAVFVGCYGCLKMPRLLPLVVSTFDIWVGMPWSNMIGCSQMWTEAPGQAGMHGVLAGGFHYDETSVLRFWQYTVYGVAFRCFVLCFFLKEATRHLLFCCSLFRHFDRCQLREWNASWHGSWQKKQIGETFSVRSRR